jgi:hypothetical protein
MAPSSISFYVHDSKNHSQLNVSIARNERQFQQLYITTHFKQSRNYISLKLYNYDLLEFYGRKARIPSVSVRFLLLTQLSLTSRTSNPIFIFSFVTEHLISFSDRREMEFKNTAVQVSFALLSGKFPTKSKG